MSSRNRTQRRPAFTLIELLAVIAIIAIIAAIAIGTYFRVRISQEEAATETTVAKLHSQLDQQYRSVLDNARDQWRANDESASGPRTIKWAKLMSNGETNRGLAILTKFKLKEEFPQTFWEALMWPQQMQQFGPLDGPGGSIFVPMQAKYYSTIIQGLPANTVPRDPTMLSADDQYKESAALLYIALTRTRRGNAGFNPNEHLGAHAVGRLTCYVDQNNRLTWNVIPNAPTKDFNVFVDTWGQPIGFVRWPFGANGAAQPGAGSAQPLAGRRLQRAGQGVRPQRRRGRHLRRPTELLRPGRQRHRVRQHLLLPRQVRQGEQLMRALHNYRRRGMTLIELVVVISLILVLLTLGLLISPRLAEDQRSVRTGDLISGWLYMCKNRAYRDQQTRGIRLIVGADGNCHEIALIERPEDYRGGVLQVPSPFVGSIGAPYDPPNGKQGSTAFLHGIDLTNALNPIEEPIVAAGDFLVFDSLEAIPYNSHRIAYLRYFPAGASPQAPQGGTHIVCATYDMNWWSVINGGAPIPVGSAYGKSDQFRFVRQPRPLVGEPTLQLPRDMVVDLPPGVNLNPPYDPANASNPSNAPLSQAYGGTVLPGLGQIDQLDILFSPRGQLQGSNSRDGKTILRIRNGTRGQFDGDQLLVVIYTRSGIISTHPVDVTPNAQGQLDPYSFVRDGESSGF